MPRYRNTTNENKVLGSNIVPPKGEISTFVWYPTLPTGLQKVSDAPMFNSVVFSDVVTSDTTVTLPNSLRNFLVDIYVESGRIEVRFNSDSNNPPLKLGDGMVWSRRFVNRLINDIRIKFVNPGSVWINVEEF